MNISKFTQKSVQAVQDLEKVAYEYGNQEIEQEHLLYTLLTQEDSLILKLIEKMEINKEYFLNTVKNALDAKVKVSGGELRFGQYLNRALVNAEDEAKAMGDEYVSVEHLFLSLLKYPSPSMISTGNAISSILITISHPLSKKRGRPKQPAPSSLIVLMNKIFVKFICFFVCKAFMYYLMNSLCHFNRMLALEDISSHINTSCTFADYIIS